MRPSSVTSLPRSPPEPEFVERLVWRRPRCHTGSMTTRRWLGASACAITLVAASLSGVAASAPAHPDPTAATTTATARTTAVRASPLRTIQGGATHLWNPGQVAVGPGGLLVAVNEGAYDLGTDWSITVHAGGASGDVAPLRRIAGNLTGLRRPTGVDIDSAGRIYVADGANDSVSVFAAGSHGNVAPARVLRGARTGLDGPAGLDVERNRLAVANRDDHAVLVFDLEASGDTAPERRVAGSATGLSQPYRVVLAPTGELTVGTWAGQVHTYASGAGGNATPIRSLTNPGGTGGPVTGLAIGPRQHLYVSAQFSTTPVVVYGPGATGSSKPVAQLEGELHDIDLPRGMTVHSDGQVVVTDEADDAIYTFADLLAAPPKPRVRKPGKVRALKVRGGPRKARRAVTWRKPAVNGGAKVTRYRVVVKKGKRTVAKRVVTKRKVVLRRGQLPKGRLVVRVQARNKAGFGKTTTKRFRVRR